MIRRCAPILVALLLWSATAQAVVTPGDAKDENNAVMMLGEYFDLLVSGNQESAMYLWTADVLDRAQRLGITYEGIPLKVDCSSPVVRNIPLMRNYLHPPVKSIQNIDSNYASLRYSQLVDGQLVEHFYYTFFDGSYYWLTYLQDYYGQSWPVTRSKYFAVHVDPSARKKLHQVVLDEADAYIERIADSLEISKTDLEHLAAGKIEYFYCGSDSIVQEITGHRIKGTYHLPTDDIISAFFPHYNELVHLLVNYKLRTLPLYTQPLLREGVAVYYGGRWGKAPSALLDLGAFLYREKIVDIDSLLTMQDFEASSSADIAYPVAGLFVSFLMEHMERDAFWQLYRSLSGDFQTLYDMTRVQITDQLAAALGKSNWPEVLAEFESFLKQVIDRRVPVLPGKLDGGKTIVETDNVVVTEQDDWLSFEFSRPPGTPVAGNLVFGLDPSIAASGSELFLKQYSDTLTFEGYRYGIRFDQFEAGLYDYATDHLMAKYIWGITPSEEYYDETSNRVTIRFRKDMIEGDLLKDEDNCRLLDN